MAYQNVIDYPMFGKETGITQLHEKTLREPEAKYSNDDLYEKIAALLHRPLWPLFPEGAYLNTKQARKLYRTAQGIAGLVHILNRATYCTAAEPLHEPQQSRLWNALIELSDDALRLTDEMLHRASDDAAH